MNAIPAKPGAKTTIGKVEKRSTAARPGMEAGNRFGGCDNLVEQPEALKRKLPRGLQQQTSAHRPQPGRPLDQGHIMAAPLERARGREASHAASNNADLPFLYHSQ